MTFRELGTAIAALLVCAACGATPSQGSSPTAVQPSGSSTPAGATTAGATAPDTAASGDTASTSTTTGSGTTTATGTSGTSGTTTTTSGTGTTSTGSGTTTTGGTGTSTSGGTTGSTAAAPNVVALTVNGSTCSAAAYLNKPCVSVTVCEPGTSTCQTIDDVLLDTGSYGLRLFSQVLTINLPRIAAGAGTLAECVQYAGASADWGPVAKAAIVLGGEPAVLAPIQVIDAGFATVPSSCPSVAKSPSDAGLNGILGVGALVQDCGTGCALSARNGVYFACSGSTCTGTTVPVTSQVQNPISLLPSDGNGLVIDLPAVSASGAPSAVGTLTLGIGTRANNAPPSGVSVLALDRFGEFTTTFAGTSYAAFVDSGSNGLFFGPPSTSPIASCAAPNGDWFCPTATLALQATDTSATGGVTTQITFPVGNFLQLLSSGGSVYPDVGGAASASAGFDWGLPFFLGRSVYVGLAGGTSPLGTGPLVAF